MDLGGRKEKSPVPALGSGRLSCQESLVGATLRNQEPAAGPPARPRWFVALQRAVYRGLCSGQLGECWASGEGQWWVCLWDPTCSEEDTGATVVSQNPWVDGGAFAEVGKK